MKKISKKIKIAKKILKSYGFRARFEYTRMYEKKEVVKNTVLIQSFDGASLSGNPYYLYLAMNQDSYYKDFKFYIVSTKGNFNRIKKFVENKGGINTEIIVINSKKYCEILATANYLINNSTFPAYFIKKEGQIYINTWHGTPLKYMGRKIKNAPNELGNTQRNFMMSDYLLEANDFMLETFKEDYMLNNIFKGEYILGGYPCNSAFYDNNKAAEIKEELGISDKKIVMYMPTWRGSLDKKNNKEIFYYTMHTLLELDKKVNDDTLIYVKLHNYMSSKIDFSIFNKVKPFNPNYETYEFLNIADCLVTDYSSVFFDYANTKRKIVLFAYDKEEYLMDRGMYLNYDELPFKTIYKTEDLCNELNNLDDFIEYSDFNKEYNNYDCLLSPKNICDYIFKRKTKKVKAISGSTFSNNKKNVLIFAGALKKNGITTSLKGLIHNIDTTKNNYFLTFYKKAVDSNKDTIFEFNNVDYIPIQGNVNMKFSEIIFRALYYDFNISTKLTRYMMKKIFEREAKRVYPNLNFDVLIHFTGYERNIMHLFNCMAGKKIIYIHNDMNQEKNTKQNIHLNSHYLALENFDKIAVVRESSKKEIMDYDKKISEEQVKVVHNLNDIERIKELSKQDLIFDSDTESNVDSETLVKILNDKKIEKIINIARFSPEKGLIRLIDAFKKYNLDINKKSCLIIIGGYGPEYKTIKNKLESEEVENVVLIKSLSNPYSILNKCDIFVLSSFYEGLPMTIMETLILNKKVLSTNIKGPKEFLEQGYGYLVENTQEGLYQGLVDNHNGKLNSLIKFDANKFNVDALNEFYDLIKLEDENEKIKD